PQGKMEILNVIAKTEGSATSASDFKADIRCSPSFLLSPRDNFEDDKNYAKTIYQVGKVVCNESHVYKMEFVNFFPLYKGVR
ncbi:hypothetical protein PFISCL1PPCAC_11082, partial [Pristionchus fissidentatus]